MAHLDTNDAYEHFRDRVIDGIRTHFPIKGKLQSLHLDGVEVKDTLHPDDIRSQHDAKVKGDTWAVKVYGTLALKDNETGKTVSSRKIRIADLPKPTSRYSFIVDGQEYQIDNQWQLKPGVYTRRRQNGELESRFNISGKNAFDILFDPGSKQFHMEYNKSKLPLYPIMRAMGVDDHVLEQSWGKEIYEANKNARGAAGTIERFYKSDKKIAATSKDEAVAHLQGVMAASKLRPDATELTLGKPFDTVNGDALHLATQKMLRVQGGHPEDDRDSLVFKDLRTAGDFAFDKIRAAGRTIQMKAQRKLATATDVRDVVKFDFFNDPIKQTFHKNSAARVATQVNPVEMVASALQTTIMGPGGIQSEQSIMDEAKFVNPSHLGFLDPINTPEGGKTGVTLRLPLGVKKVGNEPRVPLYNLKTSKIELVSPLEFTKANVVLPDQVEWKDGKPVPLRDRVMISGEKNDIVEGKFSDAHYVMRHPSQLFNITSNLIPFLGNTSGNRAGMASRHIEQAISLVHRDAPLVQVGTGVDKKNIDTFENLLGRQASHAAPVDGEVVAIHKDAIVVADHKGDKHEVQLYHNYPLNDAKSVMHSSPLVKVGDRVKAGQTIADTNYAKNGTLALGTNLHVAYVPFKGYNFEDGVVISESAAKKLSSVHLHKHNLPLDEGTITDPRKFIVEHSGAFKKDQLQKIGNDGVVKVGQRVQPGDPLVLAMKPYLLKDRTGLAAIRRSLSGAHTDKSLRWDSEHEGEVVNVHRSGKDVTVHVRTVEPMQVGDKLAGRYGNKGIVTMILPDHQMPHTKGGRHVEVALNPSGIPGRMNPSQEFEVSAAKIAEKTGKTYVVKNFAPVEDMREQIEKDLAKHKLTAKEELFDPVTGQSLGEVHTGPQHILKLMHQVDKKLSVRAGMGLPGQPSGEHYDLNLQPTGGAGTGGQSMGILGMYALLAHGAKANIREMQTWKSEGPDPQTSDAKRWPSQHNQVWTAIQMGTPLPTPAPTFAFNKFTQMLKGAGVNIEKKGHQLLLSPLTDKHILGMSAGELPKPAELVFAKTDKSGELKPKPGGLFDEKLTGGHGGTKWSHIALAEPIPNPVFEGPIKHLTGLTQKDFDAIVHGERAVDKQGKIVELDRGATGGAGIKQLLDRIDVKKDLEVAKRELATAPASKADKVLKKVKYLRALDQMGLKPSEAYVLHHVPIMPPALRPVSSLPSGDLKYADVNQLYSEFAQVNDHLKNPTIAQGLPEEHKKNLRRDLYDGVRAIVGIGVPYADAKHKGIIHQIQGGQPKTGYFQNILMNRRQDLTMRSTIVPEPALGLDEVGLPKHAALKLYSTFVVPQLVQMGAAPSPLHAQKMISETLDAPVEHKPGDPLPVKALGADKAPKGHPSVWSALDKVMVDRPVLLKRDPALHKYSVQAFKPRAVSGSAVQIHPLVCGGFNADFDGDTMSVFVPMHRDAVAEAQKMYPSNNLFSEATGKVMYQPTLESALGLYKLSLIGKDTGHKFDHPGEAIEAARTGKIKVDDLVHVGSMKTTPGRVLLATALPEPMQKKVLTDHALRIDKKGLDGLLTDLAKNHHTEFGDKVNRLKDIGNGAAFGVVQLPTDHPSQSIFVPMGTHTLSLEDFVTDKAVRNQVLSEAQKKVDAVHAGPGSKADKDRHIVGIWSEADKKMRVLHEQKMEKNPSNLFLMYKAGVKPGWEQYKQMVLAPMLLKDSADRTIPTPVTRSYSEGLDLAGYWISMHGARRGAVMKVQEVQEPGYMSKLLMNNTMHLLVNSHDCGTSKGVALAVTEKDKNGNDALNRDVLDRHLAQDFKAGSFYAPAGTLITPDVANAIRTAKKDAQVVLRSPIKCEEEKGICRKCMGLSTTGHHHDLGTNVGVQAAHAVGERAIQLTLKAFHTGGVQEQSGGGLLNSFARFQQLTMLPQKIPNSASLAMKSGKIEKMEDDPTGTKIWIGGQAHHVPRDASGQPLHRELPHAAKLPGYQPWQPPQVGVHVEAGQHLSDPNRTHINPHHLYEATKSIEQVQNHLTNEIHKLYKDEGIRRVHVETVVKAMSNLTKVVDPGDHPEVLRGEFRPTSVIKKINEGLAKEGRKPIAHTPVLKGIEMMPLDLQEDWMAKLQHQRLKDTILEAAATRGSASIHGVHPIPGIAFGAEFGLTSSVSKRPEYKHLGDVQAHHY